ncbi:hypothetical protein [Streptomyces sp. NPDC097619]|uniref:hypothetical protein n=1 Tax=Streptomyces sp. NPDC097619 TaxID=3157228 RepID=UPI00331BD95C
MYVLSALLLTPARFPAVLGDDYPAACRFLGLEPGPAGYGLVLGQDEEGARWTVVVDDVSLVAVAIASWDCGMEYDLSPDERTVVVSLAGWPVDLAVAAPDVPAPHDPEQGADGTGRVPLQPPRGDVWGPAQRRTGADEIALQWAEWRARFTDGAGPGAASGPDAPSAPPSHPGVRRALDEARAYTTEGPPPPGRVRSAFAGGEARILRVDGPGWSLVARTDDMAFVLLDEEPGQVRPVGRGAELPLLLEALDRIAVRPA